MNFEIHKKASMRLISFAAFALGAAILTSCGSGSSASGGGGVNTNQSDGNEGFVYQGPGVQTDDVQSFKVNVYDNLVADRCGTCHGVDQAPMFLDRSDVNIAYNLTNTENLVDFENPQASRLVTKVEEGHNCWEAVDSVCASIISGYIEDWATESGSVSNVIVLTAPEIKDPGATKSFPADVNDSLFSSTVYPLLTTYCAECHSDTSETQQQPFFASSSVELAYDNARTKMNLENPETSRFVVRLGGEFHNCWDPNDGDDTDCAANADEMEEAIIALADDIEELVIDEALVTSKAVGLGDGVIASAGGRVETNVIALYEFKTREGDVAFDTSGVDPAMNLTFFDDVSGVPGVEWVGSYGVRLTAGKAQATSSASAKLYNTIAAGTGEYSIEAWVVPANVSQEGPARIVSYSGGDEDRNFTLGQTLYNYNYMSRSSLTDTNAQPFVSTPDADEVLQATLQHVVAVYSPVDGRSIYVNGELVSQDDSLAGLGETLTGWDDSYAFVLGQETSGNYQFEGTIRLLAIYNRAMTLEDIQANYDAGVGEKYFLLFAVGDIIDVPDSYIVFEVQQFDDYSYLFNSPFFIVLSGDGTSVGNIPLQGMRIGINGKEAPQGQAFAKLDTAINGAEYLEGGQVLSDVGTIIALENGPQGAAGSAPDEFFLTFDLLGSESYARTEDTDFTPIDSADLGEQSLIGIKTFEEVDASLSAITTVPRTNSSVASTYNIVKQQMPTSPVINGFLSAHQMGITQLAVEYCNQLTSDASLRSAYFSGFDFDTDSVSDDPSLIIDPIMQKLLGQNINGSPLEEVPAPGVAEGYLEDLVTTMTTSCGATCDASETRNIVTGVCAAAAGSAMMLIQ